MQIGLGSISLLVEAAPNPWGWGITGMAQWLYRTFRESGTETWGEDWKHESVGGMVMAGPFVVAAGMIWDNGDIRTIDVLYMVAITVYTIMTSGDPLKEKGPFRYDPLKIDEYGGWLPVRGQA